MKTMLICLVFLLSTISCYAQTVYEIKEISSEKDTVTSGSPLNTTDAKDTQEIQRIIRGVTEAFASNDVDFIMQQLSPNFLNKFDNGVVDYSGCREQLETGLDRFFSLYRDSHNVNIEIGDVEIRDNKAFIEAKSTFEAFEIQTDQPVSGTNVRNFVLSKEQGAWKILQWTWRREPKNP
ncbi:MAG: nuclear transport factor 2 family protein [Candidatus Omnitrophica bacterium]|nr:nuclear transport factor 2 family protein [Candidatus Omnitrophota bacterium]MBU4148833.1 nuclear transport factor 2 family protein [Candidatus Omnitrophota bacterium]